ncbi:MULTISPECIES: MFS transporter [Actinosynnema]|uniref:MFS transporter n=1 Tax=Actinosynnema TaxID=40566 RepID=UPI0020A376CF|nr:MFS transporter [Actinosynnema pretiosum]MCP2098875.1 putative arabinose efflux permease, MFS family [Actinosynnema pretiosum]
MTTTEPAPTTGRQRLALSAVLAATFMGQVDGFIVTVAAPSLQRDLPATFGQVQLVGASYVLAAAAGLVMGGRLGDRYGRRKVFLAGVAVFTLASLLCGLAPTAAVLIAARFAQGSAAAALIPQELALIRSMFTESTGLARAMSAYGVVVGLGVVAGIAGGGVLVHWDLAGLGWRSAFLINVPIGAAILAAGRAIAESRSERAPTLDLAGAGLVAVGLPALLLPVVLGPEIGSTWLWLSAAVGVLAASALVLQQRAASARGGDPLFPARVLAAPGMRTGLAAIGLFFAGNSGLFLVFTFYTQTGLGHDALTAGLMFVPLGIAFAAGSSVSDRLTARFGPRLPVLGCLLLATALLAHLLVVRAAPEAQTVLLGAAICAVGLAEGLVVSPLIAGIFDRVHPDDAGATSGAASTITQIGLATGFASVGVWYRFVLGGEPGTAGFAAEDHVRAYSSAITVLAAAAVVTSGLCLLRLRAQREG